MDGESIFILARLLGVNPGAPNLSRLLVNDALKVFGPGVELSGGRESSRPCTNHCNALLHLRCQIGERKRRETKRFPLQTTGSCYLPQCQSPSASTLVKPPLLCAIVTMVTVWCGIILCPTTFAMPRACNCEKFFCSCVIINDHSYRERYKMHLKWKGNPNIYLVKFFLVSVKDFCNNVITYFLILNI